MKESILARKCLVPCTCPLSDIGAARVIQSCVAPSTEMANSFTKSLATMQSDPSSTAAGNSLVILDALLTAVVGKLQAISYRAAGFSQT